MLSRLKNLIKGEKNTFDGLCSVNNLALNFKNNRNEVAVLKDIFYNREYSDYFPFYEKVTIVDIGAHYGYFSLFSANNVEKGSRIIAIEPNKTNFKHLERNIADAESNNISCYNFAIGDKNGSIRLYQGESPNHSIVKDYLLLNKKEKFEMVEVKTMEKLIDDLDIDTIDFLKMDCEGAEYYIFNSTPDYILGKITTISMEFHDLKNRDLSARQLISKLAKNEFRIVKFHYDKTYKNLNYGKIVATRW